MFGERQRCTMRFGSTAKVLLKCKLKYYRISECTVSFTTPYKNVMCNGLCPQLKPLPSSGNGFSISVICAVPKHQSRQQQVGLSTAVTCGHIFLFSVSDQGLFVAS